MADLLRRSQAPLTDKTWDEIDGTARRVLKSQLTARAVVDVDGPHGWDLAAVNLGRIELSADHGPHDVPWGKRLVLPLLENRVPFRLDQLELDSVERGAKDADLDALEEAARRIALFEESAVYNGFAAAGIEGIIPACPHPPIALPTNTREFPEAVARAVEVLRVGGVAGPFALVLGVEAWAALMQSGAGGYPPGRIIREMIREEPYMSPAIVGGLVLSMADGNFELTLGQDFSIGYASHDRESVELYLTESFTFRVLQPNAAVRLTPA